MCLSEPRKGDTTDVSFRVGNAYVPTEDPEVDEVLEQKETPHLQLSEAPSPRKSWTGEEVDGRGSDYLKAEHALDWII